MNAYLKVLNRMADSLEDISQKLDHIIKKQTEDFFSGYKVG